MTFLFVLNQPDLRQEALTLFRDVGIDNPPVAVVEKGSAYDLITREPSVWLISRMGKVAAKHVGYERDDELVYREELERLLKP